MTPEEKHLAKVADLDGLELLARAYPDRVRVASSFESIFFALEKRKKISRRKVLEWGERYLAWINEFDDPETQPILSTSWAIRMLEIANSLGRRDLATTVSKTMLDSGLPLEKEYRWWQHQYFILKNPI